jgi:glycosyltransferase involved in cell wall biosynthesis
MVLSILVCGKNDDYAADSNGKGGVNKRLELTLNKMIDNLRRLDKDDIEVIVCDWGSDVKISDALVKERHPNMKFVYVSPDIAKKYNGKATYSIVHPYNVSFRNSKGQYVVFWDSDCFMPFEHLKKVYEFAHKLKQTNDQKFYWGSRFHIPRAGYVDAHGFQDVDSFLQTCVIDPKQPNKTSSNKVLRHDKVNIENFCGCAMCLLMPRSMGEDSSCWWEKLPYWGWQDVEFHYRLVRKYVCGGDMEDLGMFFFHLDHHEKIFNPIWNDHIKSPYFKANDSDWGLINETLEIIS